jgi:6-phosphogluconolactonase
MTGCDSGFGTTGPGSGTTGSAPGSGVARFGLKGLIRVVDGPAVAAAAADLLGRLIATALAERGVAHVLLSGGTTPRLTFERLELDDWEGVELWFGDERCVGPEDPESNFRMVEESLLPHATGALVHRIQGELGPDPAAAAYDALIGERVGSTTQEGVPIFDVNLLGIGPDGHTASLFPGNPALEVTGRSVVGVRDAPKPPPDRVSLTFEVLRAARDSVLLASGASKSTAVSGLLAGPETGTPSSLLARERLTLIADADATPALADTAP